MKNSMEYRQRKGKNAVRTSFFLPISQIEDSKNGKEGFPMYLEKPIEELMKTYWRKAGISTYSFLENTA